MLREVVQVHRLLAAFWEMGSREYLAPPYSGPPSQWEEPLELGAPSAEGVVPWRPYGAGHLRPPPQYVHRIRESSSFEGDMSSRLSDTGSYSVMGVAQTNYISPQPYFSLAQLPILPQVSRSPPHHRNDTPFVLCEQERGGATCSKRAYGKCRSCEVVLCLEHMHMHRSHINDPPPVTTEKCKFCSTPFSGSAKVLREMKADHLKHCGARKLVIAQRHQELGKTVQPEDAPVELQRMYDARARQQLILESCWGQGGLAHLADGSGPVNGKEKGGRGSTTAGQQMEKEAMSAEEEKSRIAEKTKINDSDKRQKMKEKREKKKGVKGNGAKTAKVNGAKIAKVKSSVKRTLNNSGEVAVGGFAEPGSAAAPSPAPTTATMRKRKRKPSLKLRRALSATNIVAGSENGEVWVEGGLPSAIYVPVSDIQERHGKEGEREAERDAETVRDDGEEHNETKKEQSKKSKRPRHASKTMLGHEELVSSSFALEHEDVAEEEEPRRRKEEAGTSSATKGKKRKQPKVGGASASRKRAKKINSLSCSSVVDSGADWHETGGSAASKADEGEERGADVMDVLPMPPSAFPCSLCGALLGPFSNRRHWKATLVSHMHTCPRSAVLGSSSVEVHSALPRIAMLTWSKIDAAERAEAVRRRLPHCSARQRAKYLAAPHIHSKGYRPQSLMALSRRQALYRQMRSSSQEEVVKPSVRSRKRHRTYGKDPQMDAGEEEETAEDMYATALGDLAYDEYDECDEEAQQRGEEGAVQLREGASSEANGARPARVFDNHCFESVMLTEWQLCRVEMCALCYGVGGTGRWIMCSDCGEAYHTLCLPHPVDHLSVDDVRAWCCQECKVCEECETPDEDGLLVCDKCDKAFHIYCLNPPIPAIPEGDWVCTACRPCSLCQDQTRWATLPFPSSVPSVSFLYTSEIKRLLLRF